MRGGHRFVVMRPVGPTSVGPESAGIPGILARLKSGLLVLFELDATSIPRVNMEGAGNRFHSLHSTRFSSVGEVDGRRLGIGIDDSAGWSLKIRSAARWTIRVVEWPSTNGIKATRPPAASTVSRPTT